MVVSVEVQKATLDFGASFNGTKVLLQPFWGALQLLMQPHEQTVHQTEDTAQATAWSGKRKHGFFRDPHVVC